MIAAIPFAGAIKIFNLSEQIEFCYSTKITPREHGGSMNRGVDYVVQSIFEPALNWVLDHPIVSVVVVGALIFFSVRNYRML
jgi:hypothetical protein